MQAESLTRARSALGVSARRRGCQTRAKLAVEPAKPQRFTTAGHILRGHVAERCPQYRVIGKGLPHSRSAPRD